MQVSSGCSLWLTMPQGPSHKCSKYISHFGDRISIIDWLENKAETHAANSKITQILIHSTQPFSISRRACLVWVEIHSQGTLRLERDNNCPGQLHENHHTL